LMKVLGSMNLGSVSIIVMGFVRLSIDDSLGLGWLDFQLRKGWAPVKVSTDASMEFGVLLIKILSLVG
jgi:hypothetical protein